MRGTEMPERKRTKFLSPKRISEITAVAEGTLENWRVLGIGPPYYKIGHAVRYDEAEFSAWLENRRVVPKQNCEAGR
jgi:predicted DNA-binding transcriptional regulator AlpA